MKLDDNKYEFCVNYFAGAEDNLVFHRSLHFPLVEFSETIFSLNILMQRKYAIEDSDLNISEYKEQELRYKLPKGFFWQTNSFRATGDFLFLTSFLKYCTASNDLGVSKADRTHIRVTVSIN